MNQNHLKSKNFKLSANIRNLLSGIADFMPLTNREKNIDDKCPP